jgi:hypothetical protein
MTDVPDAGMRRYKFISRIVVGAGTLVFLVIAAVIVGFAIGNNSHTPDLAVKAYLTQVVKGHAQAALKLTTDPKLTGYTDLLKDRVYQAATDRVSKFAVLGYKTTGATAVVTVRITQSAEAPYVQKIKLKRVGKDFGLFDRWKVAGGQLSKVDLGTPGPLDIHYIVNGVPVSRPTSDYALAPAFPGDYRIGVSPASEYYVVEPVKARVFTFDPDSTPGEGEAEMNLTDKGQAAANVAIDAWMDGCVSQATLTPTGGCSFSILSDGLPQQNITWTLITRPVVTFGFFSDGKFEVTTTTPGIIGFHSDYTIFGEQGTSTALLDDVDVSGFITAVQASGAIFNSSYH